MKIIYSCMTAMALTLAAIPAMAKDQVTGSLEVKGKTTTFKYVYAYWKPFGFDQSKKDDLFIIMSGEEIPADALPVTDKGMSKNAQLVREGKLHALELHLDGASNKLSRLEEGAIYHGEIQPARYGLNGFFKYQLAISSGVITGKVEIKKDSVKLLGWNSNATFEVAIPPKK